MAKILRILSVGAIIVGGCALIYNFFIQSSSEQENISV